MKISVVANEEVYMQFRTAKFAPIHITLDCRDDPQSEIYTVFRGCSDVVRVIAFLRLRSHSNICHHISSFITWTCQHSYKVDLEFEDRGKRYNRTAKKRNPANSSFYCMERMSNIAISYQRLLTAGAICMRDRKSTR